MKLTLDEQAKIVIALEADIGSVQDAMDLLGRLWGEYQGCEGLILYARDISEEFFDLSTGLAGEILQKYTVYGMKVGIVGDFTGYSSKALPAFIAECNRGSGVCFAATLDEALERMGR